MRCLGFVVAFAFFIGKCGATEGASTLRRLSHGQEMESRVAPLGRCGQELKSRKRPSGNFILPQA
jgi:hypothetical protein